MCKGVFPIAEGSSTYTVGGIAVALDGMKTACGASLIAMSAESLRGQERFPAPLPRSMPILPFITP
ncbi:PAAR domain-containing protein [Pseudomonas sp. FW306-02-F02-AA]|nr:PAAR domain-containing protein [Pseudomonas sp. FW306-02-F02-AB]PMZ08057.1 PAAR domain-containing protein [Pseudomonas sp. FW306-02-H06C]PMZ14723.1 PAAR domain-containing protein [Pseudomonas sp. FW306-02-F02-AA]PMZ20692.1 PAAR domain-containing protein [Pseudomonas sp. FW306-02-F08-AA]PMZ25383.1 PAAR domain-containing protein [Pseudomonas sp. FW306-02-F04-BA]PMZ32523.1 PAAR domain-containing protein [Pseudomonas sp. FW306-02-H06B]PMZ39405.1 PAAR domain-containing protein [Pseudomonas sp. 